MNWPRIILDGMSMSLSLLFSAVAGLGFLPGRQVYAYLTEDVQ